MSNADVVRDVFARWALGDYSSFDWADPAIELTIADFPGAVVTPGGREAVARAWGEYMSSWKDLTVELDELVEVGDRVLTITRFSGHSRTAGVEIREVPAGAVFTFRDELVARLDLYTDPDAARRAFG